MDKITFRCPACQQVLKVGADKAGRTAKCLKCGKPLTIPDASEPEKEPALAPAAAGQDQASKEPALAPEESAKPPPPDDDDDGGPMTYSFKDEPQTREEKVERPAPEVKGPGRRRTKRLAKITHAKQWVRVSFGLQVVAAGLCVWLGAFLLYRLPLIIGLAYADEYAAQTDEWLVTSSLDSGKPAEMDYCGYAVALIAGRDLAGFMIWVVRLSQVLYLLMYFLLVAGYVLCLAAPPRGGTRIQLGVLLALAAGNAFFGLIFKLAPLLRAYEYTILPAVVPEIEMISMNAGRLESIYTLWLHWPILEISWALLLTLMFYLEPAMIGVFLRACGKALKSDELEARAMTIMNLGFSQLYIQVAWVMLAMCGTSEVLLTVLRVVYTIGMGFFIGQLIYTIFALFTVRGIVYVQLGDEAEALLTRIEEEEETQTHEDDEEEDEQEEEDEEEEDED
jgi:hypothetical protein